MRPIVDRQTPVKTLPSLAVGNKKETPIDIALHSFPYSVNEPRDSNDIDRAQNKLKSKVEL